MSKTMKAIVYTRYGPPDALQLRKVERPESREDQVLVKVNAASANALDYQRFGKLPTMGRLMEKRFIKPIGKVLDADIAEGLKLLAQVLRNFSPLMRYLR